jgi:ABC-type nitrate/sulfonate/bicarbonate transport system ATPase subunit
MIQCENMGKAYGGDWILKGINLTVSANEFLAIVGPGRCGKTTLIDVLSGLEPKTEGFVKVDGEEVTGCGPKRGVVYQTTMLFPWYTVMGNVAYGPRSMGVGRKESRLRAQEKIDLVGLTGFEKSFPSQLSGGMKQKVGIARVYCLDPDVIFMDEPFGHLDAQTRYLMQREAERIWQTEKKTVVFVTNNIEEALYLADRVLVMTNCPSRIKAEFLIDLPRPRSYTDARFLEYRRQISEIIDPTE